MENQSNKKNKKVNSSSASESQGNQLKEIQNLLFGEQLGNVEEEINTFRKEIELRLTAIEKTLQASIDLQAARFSKELAEHSASLQKLQGIQLADKAQFVSAMDNMNDLVNTNSSNSAEALEKETDRIAKIMEQQNAHLKDQVDKSVELLNQNKTDRKELAGLLQSMVKSLEK